MYPQAEELSLKAVDCLRLDIGGVDLLFKDENNFVFCEVNQNPDMVCDEEIEETITVKKMIDLVKNRLNSIETL